MTLNLRIMARNLWREETPQGTEPDRGRVCYLRLPCWYVAGTMYAFWTGDASAVRVGWRRDDGAHVCADGPTREGAGRLRPQDSVLDGGDPTPLSVQAQRHVQRPAADRRVRTIRTDAVLPPRRRRLHDQVGRLVWVLRRFRHKLNYIPL